MANPSMNTMLVNPACEWVLARLPLWVGDCVGQAERNGEGGDLSTEDRRAIEQHLGVCSSCCRHRIAVEQALGILAAVAAELPVAPDAASLWPALERRMKDRDARAHSRWFRTVSNLNERWVRAWGAVDGGGPLRWAWVRDGLQEARGVGWLTRSHALPGVWARPGLVLGFSLAAAILVVLIGWASVHRQWVDAQSIISANAAPLPAPVIPPARTDEDTMGTSELADTTGTSADEPAQAETARASEVPASGLDGNVASKPAAPARLGYDLEHGIPMPPDARDAKPVY
jgi:hypothetical protein